MANSDKLLNVVFKTLDGTHTITLGGSASDHLPTSDPSWNVWEDSRTDGPLNQNGCVIVSTNSSSSLSETQQRELYITMVERLGYDSHVALIPPGVTPGVTKYYLNGVSEDENHNHMPYVMFSTGGYVTRPQYYKADGTLVGDLYTNLYYVASDNRYAVCLLGQIYQDGSFKGQRAAIRPYGGYFNRYKYKVISDYEDNHNIVVPANVIDDLLNYLPVVPEGGSASGGEGDFDGTSDAIPVPGIPGINPLQTGLCAMYQMTSSELQNLSSFLWSPAFSLDTFKKMFNDPMEAILNISILPLDLTAGASTSIKIGNITTTVSGLPISNSFKQINFGTINLHEYWGSFADYSPYTKLSIFLPFVGTQQISIDDVMNGSIQLVANCDALTGAIQYILYSVQSNWSGHGHLSVLYSWGGNLQYQIPLTASNYSQVVSSLIGAATAVVGGLGTAIATGGMTAPIALGTATASIANVMNSKTHIQRGGGSGCAMGIFGVQTPYLILERPEQIYSTNYEHTIGTPNESSRALNYLPLGSYVKVRGVHMEIETATGNELNEIESLLKAGVVI